MPISIATGKEVSGSGHVFDPVVSDVDPVLNAIYPPDYDPDAPNEPTSTDCLTCHKHPESENITTQELALIVKTILDAQGSIFMSDIYSMIPDNCKRHFRPSSGVASESVMYSVFGTGTTSL
jgi:hypothetical protein